MQKKTLILLIAMIMVLVSVFGTYTALSVVNEASVSPRYSEGSGFVGLVIFDPVGQGELGVNIIPRDAPNADEAFE